MNINPTYTAHLKHRYNSIVAYPAGEMEGATIVEIGPGRGDFLFHLAEIHPDKVVYGIEIKGKRFDKLVRRRDRRRLHNIKLVLADASYALPQLFKGGSVEAIYINFPDPWPKKRHTKNRLFTRPFLNDCARILTAGGTLSITTDVQWYACQVFDECKVILELRSVTSGIKSNSDEAYPTLFAKKWRDEGRTIYYQKFVKVFTYSS